MERSTIVRVHEGLHARPATRFVKLAKGFESEIEIVKAGKSVSAKSSVKLMLLGVKENDNVTVRAEGADAIEALEALIGYLENPLSGLDDHAAAPVSVPVSEVVSEAVSVVAPEDTGFITGIAASEGVAIGAAYPFFPLEITADNRMLKPDEIPAELARFHAAVAGVQQRMDAELKTDNLAESDRGIIAALKDIAADETLLEEATGLIRGGLDALSAMLGAGAAVARQFSEIDDPYLNARADDVQAVSRQICLALLGQQDISLEALPDGAILIAEDIGAWDFARAPLKKIGAIVCGHGGATSHVAIIARTHGIPAVLGLGKAVHQLKDVKQIAVDGSKGRVAPDPDQAISADFNQRIEEAKAEKQALEAYRAMIPQRADGTVIEVAANLGALEEIEVAQAAGAMGVGLF
ncbi:MAG: HPr family phosphocarrier protein, partial [Brucellaceae bacterium]|nr:HPr family phosphocarrier protein [Brucellaceae bacterium]